MRPEALATLENCRYCLMCRHADPLGHVTHLETLTPRGIALTAVSEQRGVIGWSPESVGVVFSEVDAGVARAHCVTDQPFSEAVSLVRADLVAAGLAPAAVVELDDALQQHHTPYGSDPVAPATATGSTALLVTDEAHYLWPGAVDAACTLLDALGLAPVVVGRGRSSGFLAASLGLLDTAGAQARALLDELAAVGAERLVVLGPGDRYTLTTLYPERLHLDWPEGIEVIELTTLLAERHRDEPLLVGRDPDERPWAYIDPTHALREPGRHDAPRELLGAALSGDAVELFWRRERAHPVGNTGLQFTHPELAEALTRARLDDARARGAERVVSDDPGTLAQLRTHADDVGLEVVGLYDLLAAQLSG